MFWWSGQSPMLSEVPLNKKKVSADEIPAGDIKKTRVEGSASVLHPPVFYRCGSDETHPCLHLVVNSHQLLLSVLQSQSSFSQSCLRLHVLVLAELLVGHAQRAVALLHTRQVTKHDIMVCAPCFVSWLTWQLSPTCILSTGCSSSFTLGLQQKGGGGAQYGRYTVYFGPIGWKRASCENALV